MAAPDASIFYAHLPSSSAPLEKRVYSWLEYTCTGMCWMHSRIKVSKSLLQYAMNLRAHERVTNCDPAPAATSLLT